MKDIIKIYKNFYSTIIMTLKISIITSLIFLNMSPLHNYPFNKICYCMGKKMLKESL